jgi:hypothetical protein
MTMKPVLFCDDGSELVLPNKWEICSHCRGEGKSSAYLGAFTRDDLDEQGSEWCEDYFAGRLDCACKHCGGAGKVSVVDWSKLTKAQKREWNAQVRAERECRAEERAERMAGC